MNAVYHVRLTVDGREEAIFGAATPADLTKLLRLIGCVYCRNADVSVRVQVWDYQRDDWYDPIGKRSWPTWDGFIDVSVTVHGGSGNF